MGDKNIKKLLLSENFSFKAGLKSNKKNTKQKKYKSGCKNLLILKHEEKLDKKDPKFEQELNTLTESFYLYNKSELMKINLQQY